MTSRAKRYLLPFWNISRVHFPILGWHYFSGLVPGKADECGALVFFFSGVLWRGDLGRDCVIGGEVLANFADKRRGLMDSGSGWSRCSDVAEELVGLSAVDGSGYDVDVAEVLIYQMLQVFEIGEVLGEVLELWSGVSQLYRGGFWSAWDVV
ncbi:hypothetical protein GGI43DRAFT_412183 [Trichoderma evansii]